MEANSEEDNNNKSVMNSNEGQSKPKRQMKTPFQLETLEKADASARDIDIDVFSKSLSGTDINYGLVVPRRSLKHFSIPHGGKDLWFSAVDSTRRSWSFKLSIREVGYPKAAITGDWSRFVRVNGCKIGDVVSFKKHIDAAGGEQFNFTVKRKIFNVLAAMR